MIAKSTGPDRPGHAEPGYYQPPKPVLRAAALMYAGAGLTAIGAAGDLFGVGGAVRASHPRATAVQLHASQNVLIVTLVSSALLEIGVWIFMARANRSGLRWARITASALCAIYTGYLGHVLAGSGSVAGQVVTGLIWLAGAGATFLLWRRESTAYFNAPVAPSPSG